MGNCITSMTGFGKSSFLSKKGFFQVEITTYNKRFLEIDIRLPKEFSSSEMDVRKKIKEKIFRGYVSCRIIFYPNEKIDEKFLLKIKKRYEYLAEKLSLKKDITLSFLLEQMKEMSSEKIKDEGLIKSLEQALLDCCRCREKEGIFLAKDIKKRIGFLENFLKKIEEKKNTVFKIWEQKIKKRLKDFAEDERVAKEIVLMAEKLDITEEIVRAKSHIKHLKKLLNISCSGKKMDFFLQEIIREVNTISSKSLSSDISSFVVGMKAEVEKIKEQVQNVE